MNKKKVICKDYQGKEYEVDSEELTLRPAVYGILIEEKKILLFKQFAGYDFPGGGMEKYESIEECLIREFKEETGYDIKPVELLTVSSSFYMTIVKKVPLNSILIYFLVKKVGGELSSKNLDEQEKVYADGPEWVELNNISNIQFMNSVDNLYIINKAIKLNESENKKSR